MQQVYSPTSLKCTMQQSYQFMWSPDYSDDGFLPSVGVSSISKLSVEAFNLIQTLEDISATKN